jgi:NADPH:quinone reductase
MRAVQITSLSGPEDSLRLVELPIPSELHPLTGEPGVLIDVHAAGASYPEVLMTRGEYQLQPALPFVPGTEVAGIVRSAPEWAALAPGDAVAACCRIGGFAEVAVAAPHLTFRLPDELDFAEGAALVLNYHTAYLALRIRGRLQADETVLVHGAAGGVGTASLQVAKGLGARAIAVVSSDAKESIARVAGADEVLRSDGPWREQATELGGGGVDVVLDPVGGDRFLDSLRVLRAAGRLVVVGFVGGPIPELRANRLLLDNIDVVGAAWGPYTRSRPHQAGVIGDAVADLVRAGHVRPVIGARHPLEGAADALVSIDRRRAIGKVVLDVSRQQLRNDA